MTKIAAYLLAVACLSASPAIQAQDVVAQASPVSAAPGEILAQVSALGTVRSKPDMATFRVNVIGRGATTTAARAAADEIVSQLTGKLVAAGVERAAVREVAGGGMIGFVGNAAFEAADEDETSGASAVATMIGNRQKRSVNTGLEVQITSIDKLSAVRRIIEEQDCAFAPPPVFSLKDNGAARRAAIAGALASARQEADAYASGLGMRVSRIVRVYDQASVGTEMQNYAQMISRLSGGGGGDDDQVVTEVRIGLEVILTSR